MYRDAGPLHWKLIRIKKLWKDRRRPDRRTDILYCHPGDFTPWHAAACTARNYGPHGWYPKSNADDRTERQRDRETDGRMDGRTDGHMDWRTYKLDWTPLGSFGYQCVDNIPITHEVTKSNFFLFSLVYVWSQTIIFYNVLISNVRTRSNHYKFIFIFYSLLMYYFW